jgi:hypothetical protein
MRKLEACAYALSIHTMTLVLLLTSNIARAMHVSDNAQKHVILEILMCTNIS